MDPALVSESLEGCGQSPCDCHFAYFTGATFSAPTNEYLFILLIANVFLLLVTRYVLYWYFDSVCREL